MKDNPYYEIGKIYYPKEKEESDNEVIGANWRVWFDGEKYFYEYDIGHFASEFKVIQISKEDFTKIKKSEISEADLRKMYEF